MAKKQKTKKYKKSNAPNAQGMKAYIAALAVMVIIIIAAFCVISGCLDEFFLINGPKTDKQGTETTAETEVQTSTAKLSYDDTYDVVSPKIMY